ncbi:nucleotidyltransferase domain-containing protein [Nanoarchaeota archaeon]
MGLLKLLKENKDARKIFGQRELKIIEKQLMGVALTQSEKNRLSRDVRRKLEFIQKVARFEDAFKLKKGAEIKRIFDDARGAVLADEFSKRVKKIFLYGSAVENQLTLSSDIDIAVQFGRIGLKEATLFRKRISGRVHSRVDVQVFETLPEKIRKEILRKGKILFSR